MANLSKALSAFGTLVKVGDGETTEVFATIAELKSVSGPTMSADVLETTTHNTPTPFKRYTSGLIDGGEISLELNFNPSEPSHGATAGIVYLMVNRIMRNWQICFPDDANTVWQCPVIVTSFEVNADPADLLMASVTGKVAGPPILN